MTHPLEQKIGRLRRRARWLLAAYAAAWSLAAVLGAALALALIDYVIRFQDHGVRLMCSLAVVAVAAWAVHRFWLQGFLQSRLGDVQLAQRIERRFPALTDRLASTIQFLKQPELDPQAGSAALRRAVIHETAAEVESLDVADVLESAPTRRALAACAVVLLVAGAFVVASPTGARTALLRMARPLGDDAWPRYYSIVFRDPPTRLASGQDFEVELVRDEHHRVPAEVQMQYRYDTPGGGYEIETETMRLINGALVARKEAVSRPFAYRAEGGDDATMDWIRLEVLEAPRLQSLRLTLHPPAYSGLASEEAAGSIVALRGTRVALAATSTKKLRRATLRLEGGTELPLALSHEGYEVELKSDADQTLIIDQTGQYWIELEDTQGLTGGSDDRYDIRAIPDQEPTVTIEQPGTNVFVTSQGEVALSIAVKDDLAIQSIELHFNRSDRTDVEDFAVPLYRGAPQAPRLAGGLVAAGKLGESRVVEHRWQLAELKLAPGAQVTFWATADDYLPQTGKSTIRRISIITPAELDERLAQRQSLVFAELERVLKMQHDARAQTRSLQIQVDNVGRIGKNDVDHAQAAELNQRQVSRTLTSPTEGVPAQIADFLDELKSNRVDSPDVERNMSAILDEVGRLGREHLGTIESDLTRFIKAAQAQLPRNAQDAAANAGAELRQALAGAAGNQDQVIASLEKMLGELGRWDNYRRFAREIAELARDQQEIARQTQEIAPLTLGRDEKQLDAQQQADLKKLAGDQIDLSRRLEKIQQQMGEMSRSLAETDPIASATVSDGLHQAQRQAISGQMREASEQLTRNQLGQAAAQQGKIARDLDDLLGILSNRREQELARLVKQLRAAEDELARLKQAQAGLRKKMQDAARLADPAERKRQLERLARQQQELEQQAARLARQLQRLQAEPAAQNTNSAAGQMAEASDSGQQGQADNADQQAAAAEKDLEEAQQQLAERRRQAEEDLAREQVARMEDSLKNLRDQQQRLLHETQRLENLRAAGGRLTRAQLGTLNDLARQQAALRGETTQLADKLALAEVINLALAGAAGHMARAAEMLELRETGAKAQGAQEAALARLTRLLAAFEKNKQPPKQAAGASGGSGSGRGGSRSDGAFVLTQLKLLRLLQEDLNDRYKALADNADDAAARKDELAELAAEQGKLAELTLKLSAQPPSPAPEDDPEKLPDIRMEEAAPGSSPDEVPPPEALEPAGDRKPDQPGDEEPQ